MSSVFTRPTRALIAAAAVCVLLAVTFAVSTNSAHASGTQGCRNARLTPKLRDEIRAAFVKHGFKLSHVQLKVTGKIFYGTCTGFTEYGRASFDPVSTKGLSRKQRQSFEDQPDIYKRDAAHSDFIDIGNTGESGGVVCGGSHGVPAGLAKLWGLSCTK